MVRILLPKKSQKQIENTTTFFTDKNNYYYTYTYKIKRRRNSFFSFRIFFLYNVHIFVVSVIKMLIYTTSDLMMALSCLSPKRPINLFPSTETLRTMIVYVLIFSPNKMYRLFAVTYYYDYSSLPSVELT